MSAGPVCGWGAALKGPLLEQQTVAVGPGYDDRLVPGRIGYVRERRGGTGYHDDLRVAVMSGAPWIMLETWNELWESTGIAETEEYGRAYIGLTRRYTDLFRSLGADGPRDGWVDLGSGEANYLLLLADAEEEHGTQISYGGREGSRPLVEPDDGAGYFHFGLPPRLVPHGLRTAVIDVEYLDIGHGSFRLQYESQAAGDDDTIYTESDDVVVKDSGLWVSHRFELPDVDFHRHQYGGYGDFRIQDSPADGEQTHVFGRVTIRTGRGERPVPISPATLSSVRAPDESRPVHLRWTGVDGARNYIVDLERLDQSTALATLAAPRVSDCRPLSQVRRSSVQLDTPATDCSLVTSGTWEAGVYLWRVQAQSAAGIAIGTVSDWSYLVVKP